MNRFVLSAVVLTLMAACGKKEEAAPPPPPQVVAPAPAPAPEPIAEAVPVGDATSKESPQPAVAAADKSTKSDSATYTVVKGDTLYRIARKHDVKPGDLAAWNNIKNPRRIRPGHKLRLSGN